VYFAPQVDERRAEARKEAAHAALEAALSTHDVEALRRTAEAAWCSEQDGERLRARALSVCEEALARAQRMLERVRASEDTTELRGVGLAAVRTAGRDTLCAMAVQTAAQDGADVNTRQGAEGEAAPTWLRVTARAGLVETVRALAEVGAEVNAADTKGFTALHGAAAKGHVEIIKALVAAGADVNHAEYLENFSGLT
jgi:hypothetical protein